MNGVISSHSEIYFRQAVDDGSKKYSLQDDLRLKAIVS